MEKRQLNTGDRITTASLREEDAVSEPKLRPITLDTYIGQEKVKKICVFICRQQNKEGNVLTMFFTLWTTQDWERLHFQIL